MKRRRVFFLICVALAPAGVLRASSGDEAVREAEIAATVGFLASPELEGRAAAERGGAITSAYLASRLQAAGFLPGGDEGASGRSYFQSVPAIRATYDPGGSFLQVSWRERAQARPGFRTTPDRGETVEVEGPLLFAGFGIKAPEYRHDDYRGVDARGKVVLVFSGEPGELPARHFPTSSKRSLAASLGAKALVVVTAEDLVRDTPDEWLGLAGRAPPLPVVYVDPEAAKKMVEGSGLDLRQSASRDLANRTVSLRLAYKDRREVTLRNVVARLGTGRGLEGEVVVVGAHWDHLGMPGGKLFPGADDNASGVAGLLAVAGALKAEPPKGAREVVLAAWTGEERGLLGSGWFTEHPVVPLPRITALVNLDMLGRINMDREDYREALQVIYSAGAPLLRDLAQRANEGVGFDLRFYGAFRFRPVSDHWSFFEAGVPFVYPFSGYHSDYHQPGDTPEKVSYARIARGARYVARLARLLAEHDGPIRLDPSIHEAPPPDPFEAPY